MRRHSQYLASARLFLYLLEYPSSRAFTCTSSKAFTSQTNNCKTSRCTLQSSNNDPSDDDASPSTSAQPSFDRSSDYDGDLFSLCFLTDDEEDGYSCSDSSSSTLPYPSEKETDKAVVSNLVLRYTPILMPILAYSTYELTAQLFDSVVEVISNNNWVAVDGGAYQSSIITPAINGLVVPSMALLFATLMSNTINTLRQRQLQIRTSLNIEANDLRMLSVMIDSIPSELRPTKNRLRMYLIQYASRVMKESEPGLSFDNQKLMGSIDSEINGFLRVINSIGIGQYSTMYVDTMLPAAEYEIDPNRFTSVEKEMGLAITPQERRVSSAFIAPCILSEIYDALTRLRHERSVRLSALQSTYPPLHYAILALLGCSICGVFLMETNQNVLIFMTAIQLRILWAMLIGTFSSLAVVNYDMIDPFRGSYNVAVSVNQFYTIREAIRSMMLMDEGDDENEQTEGETKKKVSESEIIDSFEAPGDGTIWL